MIEAVELIIRQSGHPQRVVQLPDGVTRLGRAEDNDVVLSDIGISRRHARLVVTRDQVRVEDLGSGNGTYFKGMRVQNQVVEDGDELVVDPFVLQFRVKGKSRKSQGEQTLPPGSSVQARLEVVSGGGLEKKSFVIGVRGLTLGRSETRDVVLPDPAASRHHCSILANDNRFLLRDMGSANGVFVNGMRVREASLSNGDRVRIGNTEFRFVVAGSVDTPATPTKPEEWTEDPDAHREVGHTGSRVAAPTTGPPATEQGFRGMWLALLALALLFAGVLGTSVIAVAAVIVLRSGAPAPAAPPAWELSLPAELEIPYRDPVLLKTAGMEALREGNTRVALEDFYGMLLQEPGLPVAKRLAYAAGERLLIEAMESEMKRRAAERIAAEAIPLIGPGSP